LIFAAGSDIWSYPAWNERTGNAFPPFHKDATPTDTKLESWQLTVLQEFSQGLNKKKSLDDRILFIQDSCKEAKFLEAANCWDSWIQRQLISWNIQPDIEEVLLHFDRHPSQMNSQLLSALSDAELVSPQSSFKSFLPSPSFKESLLAIVASSVADQLFGDDAYRNPSDFNPLVKYELYRFAIILLSIVWRNAKHNSSI
jgi:hypothetical protein